MTVFPLASLNSPLGWAVVLFLGLVLFGRRLPGVARSLGQGINEFKRGLNDAPVATRRLEDGSAPAPAPRKTEIEETSV